MEEKARLLKQKNELSNLMKTVANNIEPKRFKSLVGGAQGQSHHKEHHHQPASSASQTTQAAPPNDELLEFDSSTHLPTEPSSAKS